MWSCWTRLGVIPAGNAFGVWIRALIALLNVISLAFDGVDVIRYVDQAETVKGL